MVRSHTKARLGGFVLSNARRRELDRLFKEEGLSENRTDTIERLERCTANFHRKLRHCRPSIEAWDRSLGAGVSAQGFRQRLDPPPDAELAQLWLLAAEADDLLRDFCIEIAEIWHWDIGKPLPTPELLPPKVTVRSRSPSLKEEARRNPFALLITAIGLQINWFSVGGLVEFANRQAKTRRSKSRVAKMRIRERVASCKQVRSPN